MLYTWRLNGPSRLIISDQSSDNEKSSDFQIIDCDVTRNSKPRPDVFFQRTIIFNLNKVRKMTNSTSISDLIFWVFTAN